MVQSSANKIKREVQDALDRALKYFILDWIIWKFAIHMDTGSSICHKSEIFSGILVKFVYKKYLCRRLKICFNMNKQDRFCQRHR